eukprot:3570658-Amphidinium_carterae.1
MEGEDSEEQPEDHAPPRPPPSPHPSCVMQSTTPPWSLSHHRSGHVCCVPHPLTGAGLGW